MKTTNHHPTSIKDRIAYFISPHGYGHAARAAAVMAAVQELDPAIHFEIFTKVPAWFFQESLSRSFCYHELLTDIGLVQKNSLVEDLPATIQRLDDFLPFNQKQVKALAGQLRALQPACRLVLCDISPLGLAVAAEAGIPAILIENFTWDWIYRGYEDYQLQLAPHVAYLQTLFEAAPYHIQTEPVCTPGSVDLMVKPVSRKVRASPAQVRQRLSIPEQAKMVVLSMGGMAWDYTFLEQLEAIGDIYIVVAGHHQHLKARENLIFLQRDSGIFHPDLINSCDAVIGKVGYSTVAEVYQGGVSFGYIARPHFRESPILSHYARVELNGLPFTESDLRDGSWLSKLPELLELPRTAGFRPNGADQVASFVYQLID